MLKYAVCCSLFVLVVSNACAAEQTVGDTPNAADEQKLLGATYVEWGVAHCEVSKIPAPTAMIANMVINGSDKTSVETARQKVANGINSHFSKVEDACSEFYRSLSN